MVRVSYLTKPYERKMEVFQGFTGGLNTVSAPDTMTDTELTDLLNINISERGSLKRRYGMKKIRTTSGATGLGQGYFRYYKTDGTFDEIIAIGGKLYRNSETTPINSSNLFQTTKPIEAVQYNGILYFATGTVFLQYDGTTCSVVSPYQPSTMEMLYVGTNALASDPTGFMHDSTGTAPSIDWVLPDYTDPGHKQSIIIKAFCTVVSGTTYEFAVQSKKATDTSAWPTPTSWGTRNGSNALYGGRVNGTGDYLVRVSMRETGTTAIVAEFDDFTYSISTEPLKATSNLTNINKCNRILVHWDRLLLFGNPDSPATVYMTQLNTPNYFPGELTIDFDSPKRETITAAILYRDGLVIFTKSSVQYLTGTGPDDYKRIMLHTDLGCISPYGAVVVKNYIAFLSLQGVYSIRTIGYGNPNSERSTVEKMDIKITNIIPQDPNTIALFNEEQVQFTFPATKQRLRYYDLLQAWTKDYSDHFNFDNQCNINGVIYGQVGSTLYQFDETVYNDDDYNYTNMWESRYLSFGQPYHNKKLREIHVLANPNNDPMSSTIEVFADEQAILTPDSSYASVVNGVVQWNVQIEPNFIVNSGTQFDSKWILGDSVMGTNKFSLNKLHLTGKCLRTRVRMTNTQPNENNFIGFAYIFKIKKVQGG